MRWWKKRNTRQTLTDVIAKNMNTPDNIPTPPVDLLMILMGAN